MERSSPGLTEQQHLAVVTRQVSIVLSSGAGCGKTHVLTERYLSHLRDDRAEVGQVVAITFTDRAARQMRGRIRRAITQHLLAASDAGAVEAWSRHLRGLDTAPISTIHAFCGTLLRQHALEAGLDPSFDVLEEVLATNVKTEALQQLLQKLLTSQGEAGEDLRQLVLVYGWYQVMEGVRQLLTAWDERPWLSWLEQPASAVAERWVAHARTAFLPAYLAHRLASRSVYSRCRRLLREQPPGTPEMRAQVAPLLGGMEGLPGATNVQAAIEELHGAARIGHLGKKAWPAEVYEEVKNTFTDLREELSGLRKSVAAVEEDCAAEEVEKAVAVARRLARVVREAALSYAARKKAHSLVDFQDLLQLTRDLLRERADIRGWLQRSYRFLLIDELQDTDPAQMELVELLCGREVESGKLFAVGDASQSIYRFRGAEVSLFQSLRQRMPFQGQQELTFNFRSQPAILHFANALLGHRLQDYRPLEAFHEQTSPGPCVEFLWSAGGEAPPAGEEEAGRGQERSGAARARAAEAERIAARIASLLHREELVVDRGGGRPRLRPVRAGDVVLLFRAMSNVHIYEEALRRWGLHYYLVGGRAFFAQQEVYDILNLLRALENPQDGVSLAGVLRSPFCCLSDEALFLLARHPEGMWRALQDDQLIGRLPADQRERARRAGRFLLRWRGQKDRLPLAGLLGAVFADSGYDAATQLEMLGDRKLANLWKLTELARTFDRSGLFSLADFIARLDELVHTQAREEQAATQPENADVVRLMSIHQSKGLEFPVVVIPDMVTSGGSRNVPIARWDDALGCVPRPPRDFDRPPFSSLPWQMWQGLDEIEEWNEDLRTLYVACTRAQDYLVLSSSLPEKYRPANPWMITLAERFDLATGRCLVPGLAPEETPRLRVFDRLDPLPPAEPLSAAGVAPLLPPLTAPAPITLPAPVRRSIPLAELVPGAEGDGSEDAAALEGILRAVLRQWQFADASGWRSVLDRQAGARAALRPRAEAILEPWSRLELRARLGDAALCLREEEIFVSLNGLLGDGQEEALPFVSSTIDCLWQDRKGGWHLLYYALAGGEELVGCWGGKLGQMVVGCLAVRARTGSWPGTLTLAGLLDGRAIRKQPARLGWRRVVQRLVSRLRGQRATPRSGRPPAGEPLPFPRPR